jgi:type IV secretion system protein VirB8
MTEHDTNLAASAAEREALYAEARSWAVDSEHQQRKSNRIAWIIAAVATVIALLEALALVALTPLKQVVPYTLLVDRTTGYVQVLDGTQPQKVTQTTALTQSMLAQYVIARETFEINSLAEQYKKVSLWSGDTARRDYLALMPTNNPLSPLNVYPRSALVTTTVESVTPTGPDTAQVRFITERRDQGQALAQRGWWAAQIRYRYSGEPMSLEDRLANPLGFQVIEYRRDQEAVPQPGAAPAPPAPAPALGARMVVPQNNAAQGAM